MSGSIHQGRRALELGAAALAGLAVGVAVGWLAFGRYPGPDERPAAQGDRPEDAPPGDPHAEIRRLSETVAELSDAVRRLAAAAPRSASGGGAPPRRPRPPPPEIAPGVKFHDTFEAGTDGWLVLRFVPAIIGEVTRTEEEGRVREGKGALALSYELEPGKIPLVVRMGPSAKGINRLSLWIRTLHRPAEVMIGAQERDESSYETMVHLDPNDGWKKLEYNLAQFTLSDDSKDENDRLDFHEIRSVIIADAAGFLGGKGENVLLIDEVVGEHRRAKPEPPQADEQRF